MALNLGSLSSGITSWMTSGIFWLIIIGVAVFGFMGMLWYRRNKALNKPVLELMDLGEGRFDMSYTYGGWMKKHVIFKGLWSYGNEQIYRLRDMTPIYDVSHNDYTRINGQNGLVVVRSPNDPKFAIPITKFFLSKESKSAIAEIAPVHLRDVAVEAIEQTDTEMLSGLQKWALPIAVGVMGLVALMVIMFTTQYGQHMVQSSGDTLKTVANTLASSSNACVAQQGQQIIAGAP